MASVSVVEAYSILEVASDASDDELRAAYKKLALRHHPDKNVGNPAAHAEFIRVSEAFEVINRSKNGEPDDYDDEEDDDDDEDDDGYEYDDPRSKIFTQMFARMFFGGSGGMGGMKFHFSTENTSFEFASERPPQAQYNSGRVPCNCPNCRQVDPVEKARLEKLREQELAERRELAREMKELREANRKAEAARIEAEKLRALEEKQRRLDEEKRAAAERAEQRMSVLEETTELIEKFKDLVAKLKANKDDPDLLATLDKTLQFTREKLLEKCSDGSNLISVKVGRDKLIDVVKKANKIWSDHLAVGQAEQDRILAAEQAEIDRLSAIETEKKRKIAAEEAEKKRLVEEKAEKARQAIINAEKKRQADVQANKDRQAAALAEKRRLAAVEAEKVRQSAEQERLTAVQKERERQAVLDAAADLERRRAAAVSAAQREHERILAVQAENVRRSAQQAEQQKRASAQAEKDRLAAQEAAQEAERSRIIAGQRERDRQAALDLEQYHLLVSRSETERQMAIQSERNRQLAAQAELDRLAADEALSAAQADVDRRIAAAHAEKAQLESLQKLRSSAVLRGPPPLIAKPIALSASGTSTSSIVQQTGNHSTIQSVPLLSNSHHVVSNSGTSASFSSSSSAVTPVDNKAQRLLNLLSSDRVSNTAPVAPSSQMVQSTLPSDLANAKKIDFSFGKCVQKVDNSEDKCDYSQEYSDDEDEPAVRGSKVEKTIVIPSNLVKLLFFKHPKTGKTTLFNMQVMTHTMIAKIPVKQSIDAENCTLRIRGYTDESVDMVIEHLTRIIDGEHIKQVVTELKTSARKLEYKPKGKTLKPERQERQGAERLSRAKYSDEKQQPVVQDLHYSRAVRRDVESEQSAASIVSETHPVVTTSTVRSEPRPVAQDVYNLVRPAEQHQQHQQLSGLQSISSVSPVLTSDIASLLSPSLLSQSLLSPANRNVSSASLLSDSNNNTAREPFYMGLLDDSRLFNNINSFVDPNDSIFSPFGAGAFDISSLGLSSPKRTLGGTVIDSVPLGLEGFGESRPLVGPPSVGEIGGNRRRRGPENSL